MGGPGSGKRRPPAVKDPVILALEKSEHDSRAATEACMQAVRDAPTRKDCIERSRELWHADAALLPLVLKRWSIHEDEIREAVRRPPPIADPLIVESHLSLVPWVWTRPVP